METPDGTLASRLSFTLFVPADYLDCSFGFRPGRSAHQALQAVRKEIMDRGGRWVLDVDVRKYFAHTLYNGTPLASTGST